MNRNTDLETFEHDDWLQKEKLRESRISAWDFDDARKLREEHAEDCDVRETAQRHHAMHLRSEMSNDRALSKMEGKTIGNDVMWFIILFVAMIVMVMLNAFVFESRFMLPTVILFLAINPGIFIWIFLFKRFPSARYSKTVIAIAILLELAYLFMSSEMRYYFYRLFYRFFY